VADGWCWFVLREKYCWLVAGGWFVVREKYCWLVADKPSEQGISMPRKAQSFLRPNLPCYPTNGLKHMVPKSVSSLTVCFKIWGCENSLKQSCYLY
jgi:hypothetical protein